MIDTISSGLAYKYHCPLDGEGPKLRISFDTENVLINVDDADGDFEGGEVVFVCDQARTAREIAGALVAWATRQETQQDLPQTEVGRIAVLAAGRGVDANMGAPSNCKNPKIWEASGAHRRKHRSTGECSIDKVWREEWYRRNVGRMTLETLKRNRQDEKGILDNTTDKDERADIIRALNVIDDELHKRDQG